MGLRPLTDGILNRSAALHILTGHLQDCFHHTSAPNQHLHIECTTPPSKEEKRGQERRDVHGYGHAISYGFGISPPFYAAL